MWCARCQADVAAEASPDSQRLHCAACGSDLSDQLNRNEPPESGRSRKDPYELLARWSGEKILDPFGPLLGASTPAMPVEEPSQHEPPSRPQPPSGFRIDGPHRRPADPVYAVAAQASSGKIPTINPSRRARPQRRPRPERRLDPPQAVTGPHFPLVPAEPSKTNWVAFAGQMFAYLGVGVLTIGTVLVLSGYFGGNPAHAPTGWLISTIGQMLLFLGVITLVSGGMEQTTQEVSRRIDALGATIYRIEEASRKRGPTRKKRARRHADSPADDYHEGDRGDAPRSRRD